MLYHRGFNSQRMYKEENTTHHLNYSTFLNEVSENFLNLFRKEKSYLNRSFGNNIYFTNKKKTTYVKILNNINFKLKKGQALAILGKNGVGKTTLLKIIVPMKKKLKKIMNY